MGDWLKNRVAVITGSGQGIGRAIAIAMAKEGSRLVTNSRQPGASGGDAETTAKEIRGMGGQAVSFFGDISKFEVAAKLIRTAMDLRITVPSTISRFPSRTRAAILSRLRMPART